MPVQEKAASIEKNGQETVQELSEKFLVNEETGVIDKIKNVLNILRPHEFRDAIYKIVGVLATVSGLNMSRIAFLNPEQMNILGKELSSGDLTAARVLAVCSVLMGGIIFSAGIRDALDHIRIDKKIEAESKKE